MSKTILPNVSRLTRPLSLDLHKERKANAKVTTAITYKRGDLLVLSNTNVLTHPTDEKTWNVICAVDLTADEASLAAANDTEIPIYMGGIFNIDAVTISGNPLTKNQFANARAKATLNHIELAEI